MFDLSQTPWARWTPNAIAADASARGYTRLTGPSGDTVILMDSGPVPLDPFCNMAAHLAQHGFCAPQILHRQDPFAILTDLGQTDLAQALDVGVDAQTIYAAAVDTLVRLRDTPAPDLDKLTPDVAGDMVRITAEHYAASANADQISDAVRAHMAQFASVADRLALRDYHVENLIWRGTNDIGLLDFQDAFVAPDGYDLASLLRDVRRPVLDSIVIDMTARYCAASGIDPVTFAPQLACLGAQRNLRILGVFARLIRQDGKQKYATLMPRVWENLMADLGHPALSELRAVVLENLPPPDQAGFA